MEKNKKQNKEGKKNKRKVLLATLIPLGVLALGAAIALPIVLTKKCTTDKATIELSDDVKSQGVTLKSSSIEKNKESSFELELPAGKTISDITITIGNLQIGISDVTIVGNKITIPADKMIDNKVVVKSITLYTPEVKKTATITYDTSWTTAGITLKNPTSSLTESSETQTISLPYNACASEISGTYTIKCGEVVIKSGDLTFKTTADTNTISITATEWAKVSTTTQSWTVNFEKNVEIGKFNGVDWKDAISAIDTFEAIDNPQASDAVTLCKALGVTDATAKTDAKSTLEEYVVGKKGTLLINNLLHGVVCVGAMHDKDVNDKPVALTFHMDNVICGTGEDNKKPLLCPWSKINTEDNRNYLNSSLIKNLNDTGDVDWYEWDDDEPYYHKFDGNKKSCLSMLSDKTTGSKIIVDAIKPTKHYVATTTGSDWSSGVTVDTEYTSKLFIPKCYDMTDEDCEYCKETKTASYKYYSNLTTEEEKLAKRAKKDLTDEEDNTWNYWLTSPCVWDAHPEWIASSMYLDAGGKAGDGMGTADASTAITFAFSI